MKKILAYSFLIVMGLIISQVLPGMVGEWAGPMEFIVRALTMTGLAFIMIHVGFEFHIDKSRLRSYGWDYVIAFTAATFPWIFVTLYFLIFMLPDGMLSNAQAWKETLLAGRFAAPTSAGVLFTMLAAAGLAGTWVFKKARVLAIFDDLDTVLLMIPLKMLMVGLAWQLGLIGVFMIGLLLMAYFMMHKVTLPVTWKWVLGYAVAITACSEAVYALTTTVTPDVPIHIEVLMPAFVLGCIARPAGSDGTAEDAEHKLHNLLSSDSEKSASAVISGGFMFFVGLTMPVIFVAAPEAAAAAESAAAATTAAANAGVETQAALDSRDENQIVTGAQPAMAWSLIAWHVLMVTVLSNLGKMFPLFCYRKEAHWKHRLALAIGMWPRGEVGAGVLVVSISYGIGGPILTVAMLSLALNLLLTGVFVSIARRLIQSVPLEQNSAASIKPA